MRTIVLTHGGAEPLIERLAALPNVAIAGLFVETEAATRRSIATRLRRSIRYDGCGATMAKLGRRALVGPRPAEPDGPATSTLDACAAAHGVPIHRVARYADPASLGLVAAASPDLGLAWGTNILPPAVFELPRLGTINVHQGHTPHYRGGPSVFWELFNGEPHVGVTVHHVAAAVDAGDVILQELVPLAYDFDRYGLDVDAFLRAFRAMLRQRGADLMADAVRRIALGTAPRQPQDLRIGRRYRLPTRADRIELERRLRARAASGRQASPLDGAHMEPS